MAETGIGHERPAPTGVSRVRAGANMTALVGAILFMVLLVFSFDRPAVVWYVARVGLITVAALVVSFAAILIENRIAAGASTAAAVRTVANGSALFSALLFFLALWMSVRDHDLVPAAVALGLLTFVSLIIANMTLAVEKRPREARTR